MSVLMSSPAAAPSSAQSSSSSSSPPPVSMLLPRPPAPRDSCPALSQLTQISIPPRPSGCLLRYQSPSLSPASSACSVSPLSSSSSTSPSLSSPTPSSPHSALHLSAAALYQARFPQHPHHAGHAQLYQHLEHLRAAHKSSPPPLLDCGHAACATTVTMRTVHSSKRRADGEWSQGREVQLSLSPTSPSFVASPSSSSSPSTKRARGQHVASSAPAAFTVSPRAPHSAFPPRPVASPTRALPSPRLSLPSPSLSPLLSPQLTPSLSPPPHRLLPPSSSPPPPLLSPSARRRHFLLTPIAIPSPPLSPLCVASPSSSPHSAGAPFHALQSRYVIHRTLQQSLFTSTKLASTLPPQPLRLLCIKVARRSSAARLQREAELLQWVHREGKVAGVEELVEYAVDADYEYLVTALGEQGDLWSVMEREKSGKLDAARAQRLFAQIVAAVRRLHEERRVAHLDLSLENIVLEQDGSVLLIDFGSAAVHPLMAPSLALTHPLAALPAAPAPSTYACKPYSPSCPLPSKPSYSSPELTLHQPFDAFACDVFALGVLLYTLVTGHPPFERAVEEDPWYRAISSGSWLTEQLRSQPAAKVYQDVDDQVLRLIGSMICAETQRCSLDHVYNHPWVKQGRQVNAATTKNEDNGVGEAAESGH